MGIQEKIAKQANKIFGVVRSKKANKRVIGIVSSSKSKGKLNA